MQIGRENIFKKQTHEYGVGGKKINKKKALKRYRSKETLKSHASLFENRLNYSNLELSKLQLITQET